MSNKQRKDTEQRCTSEPYEPWSKPRDAHEKKEGAEVVLTIGTFPDDLPQLADYVTITDNFGPTLD